MPLSSIVISERIINRLDEIGIQSRVGGNESETAALVKLIVSEVVYAIQNEANVNTSVRGTCTSPSGAGTINGSGTGGVT